MRFEYRVSCLEMFNTRGGGGFCWIRVKKTTRKIIIIIEISKQLARKGERGKRLQSFTMGITVAGDVIGKRENWIGLKAKMATFSAIIIVCITPSVNTLLDSQRPSHCMCRGKKSSELNSLLFFPASTNSIRLELKIWNLAWKLLDQKSLTRYTPCFASCCNTSTEIRPNYRWL